MKKGFKFAIMALAVLGLTTACKQKATENTDTLPMDTMPVIEEVVSDTTLEDTVEAVAPATKKVVKKAEKEEAPKDPVMENAGRTKKTGGVSLTKADGTKTNVEDANKNINIQKANTTPTNTKGELNVPTRSKK